MRQSMSNTFQKSEVGKDGISFPYPGYTPSSKLVWPAPSQRLNQIQQTKGSAKPQTANVLPTTQPNQSSVAPRTTPQHVSNVRVVVSTGTLPEHRTITVQFNHPSGDPYFAGANVYLRKAGSAQPVLVAGGAASPLKFTTPLPNPSNPGAYAVHVTSFGNWGETDVMKSPSHPLKLAP